MDIKPKKKSKGSKPGRLKDRILALLEAAGDEGVRVKDIAEKLATKPGNIAVWFSTTGKAITKKVVAKPAKKAPAKKVKRKLNPALMKPIQPDAVLGVIVGSKPLPRSQMTKKLWDYIKKNNLQDAKKRTLINADDALKAVFGGKKQVSMFEMTELVSKHVK